jgi:hypothetical protein
MAAATAVDAGIQGVERATDGKDFSFAEVIGTTVLAGVGHGGTRLVGAALRRDPLDLSASQAEGRRVSRTEFTMWQHRSPAYNEPMDESIDMKLKLVERGHKAILSRNEAKRLLIRENADPGDSSEQARAKIHNSLQMMKTMDSPVTVRMSQPGEHHYRYTDRQDQGPQLTAHCEFATPRAARQALNLAAANHGWLRQQVLTREPTLVMEGHAIGGTGNHTVLVREDEMTNLEFGTASRYGVSASAQEGAADMGRIAHDGRTEAGTPEGDVDMHSLRVEAQELYNDARDLNMDARWRLLE